MNTIIMALAYIMTIIALLYSIVTMFKWLRFSIMELKVKTILDKKIRKEDK